MRLLVVDDETPSFVMYPQTDGFLRALSARHHVTTIRVDTSKDVYDLTSYRDYDAILVWQSVTSHRQKDLVRLYQLPDGVPSAAVVSDFFHPHLQDHPVVYNPFMRRSLQESDFTLVFTTYSNVYEWSLLLPDTEVAYLPYCVDPSFFCDLGKHREDRLLVCCSTDSYLYPFRTRVIDLLRNQSSIPCHFKVNAHEQWGLHPDQLIQDYESRRRSAYSVLQEYRSLLNGFRWFLATTSIGPGVELKFAEAILCGACVVGDIPGCMHDRYGASAAIIHSCMTDEEILASIRVAMEHADDYTSRRHCAQQCVMEDFAPEACVEALITSLKRHV